MVMKMKNNTIEAAIANNDLEEIIAELIRCIKNDPSGMLIKHTIQEYENQLPKDLWHTHNNETFANKSEWSYEYLAHTVTELKYNFSKERFSHAINVGKFLDGDNKPYSTESDPAKSKLGYVVAIGVIAAVAAIIFIV